MKPFLKNANKKPWAEIKSFLSHQYSKTHEDKAKLCEEDLTKKDLYNSVKSMQNDKSPGNDGLTKELYETFWKKLKKIFIDSMSETRQAIIRLIEKKIKIRDSYKIAHPFLY